MTHEPSIDDLTDAPPCSRCGGATALRYVDYGEMGADTSWICVRAKWVEIQTPKGVKVRVPDSCEEESA